MATTVPHLAYPLAVTGDGALATVEQDGTDDITQCVRVALATTQGERIEDPTYGLPDPTHRVALDEADPWQVVADAEPRADLAGVTVGAVDAGLARTITVLVNQVTGGGPRP